LSYPSDSSSNTDKILTEVQIEKRNKILDWLSPRDFNSRHKDLQKGRLADSGQWFINSEEFKGFVDGGHSCLLCDGVGLFL
jgi:hypothetical protein